MAENANFQVIEPTEKLLTANEVARAFRVDPKTVTRWAGQGKLPCVITPGGRRRYPESEVRKLLAWSQLAGE